MEALTVEQRVQIETASRMANTGLILGMLAELHVKSPNLCERVRRAIDEQGAFLTLSTSYGKGGFIGTTLVFNGLDGELVELANAGV